jgi:DNA polymerase-3 subunit epsilon
MRLLTRLFRPHIELPAGVAGRLNAWQALPRLNERTGLDVARFVVVDVETSGLDPRRDRLLAIGAVAVEAGRLRPGEGYDVTVHNPVPSARANILVHGISPDAQTAGLAVDVALMGFLELARHDVLVAFHAGFDQAVLQRALREQLGIRLPNLWLDVAYLAPALVPETRPGNRNLDDWLAHFDLRAHSRHNAAYDAYATAELLLILLARATRAGITSVGQLLAAGERQARLLS